MGRKKTTQQFLEEVENKNPNVQILGNYLGAHEKIKCKCKICGHVWNAKPCNILNGSGCSVCGRKRIGDFHRKQQSSFITELANINPNIKVLGKYINSSTKIECKCLICGNEWKATPNHLLRGRGCKKCGIERRAKKVTKTKEQFINDLKYKNKYIKLNDDFINRSTMTSFKCLLCGEEWNNTPHNVLQNCSCPFCSSHSGTSFVEKVIYLVLRHILGKKSVFSRNRKAIGKELDIYIPDQKIAIEYGSWFWHKNKIEKDNEKRKICEDNGISLITIYDSYDDNSISDNENIMLYKEDLGSTRSSENLKKMIYRLLENLNQNYIFSDTEWDEIVEEAYFLSRRKNTRRFIEELRKVNSDISVLGEYQKSSIRIKVRCKKCSHEWSPTPASLLSGYGCPKCSNNIKITNNEFKRRLKRINPDILPVGEYDGSNNKVLVKCRKCGHEWEQTANHLLRGHGCKLCAGLKRKTQDEFINELSQKNNNIKVLGTYINRKTPILVKCKKCGLEWEPQPTNLLQGHGCPNCSDEIKKNKLRLSNNEATNRIKSLHKNISLKGNYTRSIDRIPCLCLDCGHEWSPIAGSLLAGHGCPRCGKKR